MDGKGGRELSSEHDKQRQRKVVKNRKNQKNQWKVLDFIKTHKQSLLAGVLLAIATMLLFGIFSQFQAPAATVPNGVTPVSYNIFVSQAKAGNMMAATIHGDEISGLLIKPLAQSQSNPTAKPTVTAGQRAADFAAWSRYTGASSMWASGSNASAFDPTRVLYTHLPENGDPALMSLLISNHVIVNTLPLTQPPVWLSLLWRFAPLLVVVIAMSLFLLPRGSSRSMRNIDAHISQTAKGRVRRFERVQESRKPEVKESHRGHEKPKGKPGGASATALGSSAVPRVSIDPPTTFADVAGIDEVRTELEEIVQFLRTPDRYDKLGARIPRGALLVGPPGTGKTLLARAVAGEAGVPFFSMSASEFVEMFVGVGASRVRDLFNQARQSAPAVIFIDELDAVGRKRSMRITGNDERDQTLNQLLVELDGFNARQAVVVMAATNRVDILDKALLRPGRFDRHIHVSPPDRPGREAILKVHTRRTPLHEDVSLERLSRITTGMTGADLANLVNEAALCAARRNLERVDHECFEDALARVQLGALRPLVMSDAERRIIAYHEGGHALVAYHLKEADSVNRVTILPRGQSLGVTQFTAEEDRYNHSRESLMARIAVGLGGRVAEELTLGPERVTTGAENDFQVVTGMARRMVTRWGMSEQIGVIFTDYDEAGGGLNMRRLDPSELHIQGRTLALDANGQPVLNGQVAPLQQYAFAMAVPGANPSNSTSLAALIDQEVQQILNEGRAMARQILTTHFDQLTKLADALIEREQLSRAEFEALLCD